MAASSFPSGPWAPLATRDSGTPRPSTHPLRLRPFFPRSGGFGPTQVRASGAFTLARRGFASPRQCPPDPPPRPAPTAAAPERNRPAATAGNACGSRSCWRMPSAKLSTGILCAVPTQWPQRSGAPASPFSPLRPFDRCRRGISASTLTPNPSDTSQDLLCGILAHYLASPCGRLQ
jgi:hypothetical protein